MTGQNVQQFVTLYIVNKTMASQADILLQTAGCVGRKLSLSTGPVVHVDYSLSVTLHCPHSDWLLTT